MVRVEENYIFYVCLALVLAVTILGIAADIVTAR